MNSLTEGRSGLEQAVDDLLTATVSPGSVPEPFPRVIALKAMAPAKPPFPYTRIAAVLVAGTLAGLFAASNAESLNRLAELASVNPLEGLLHSMATVGFEKTAAALAVLGGVAYTVYTFAAPRTG